MTLRDRPTAALGAWVAIGIGVVIGLATSRMNKRGL